MGQDSFDFFLEIVGMGTLIVGALCLVIYFIGLPKDHYLDGMAFKTCYPYTIATRFKDFNHELVVCRVNNVLVVREIDGDFRDKD